MAVPLDVVKSSNAKLKDIYKPGMVGVFVGGTSGIGEFTLKAFAKHTSSPKIYIIGRNSAAAATITEEVKTLNADSKVHFIKADTSLLKNVDEACREIQAAETQVNILFLTTGFLTLAGRDESAEGIDKKLCLNYYSRWRFVHNLLPQLTSASSSPSSSSSSSPSSTGQPPSLSRVISILAPGTEGPFLPHDMSLKSSYGLMRCGSHAVIMNDFACEEMARQNPGIAFVHAHPGFVKTGIMDHGGLLLRLVGAVAPVLMRPWITEREESGERNLFCATAGVFASRSAGGGGGGAAAAANETSAAAGGDTGTSTTCIGSDGTKGSGAYLLDSTGKPVGRSSVLRTLRSEGMGPKIWEHTLDMFKVVEK